ncbi:hypothetical protein [Compostimonas suwonensis]|uniref:Sporulation protein YtfJ n=1 Tax=Compostimonas suwonensis TaxID=1048394 RepID=A0A2M9BZR5_9MICO|nr:hypothetical protein [Compostimonas suwonensis]PJJ63540.1 hypothetical protein CLV54_1210 [Compostimonas suwonensis]
MTSLAVQLAETVKSLGVGSVYGEPVEVEGVTLVPVALVYYGFGGGSDGRDDREGRDAESVSMSGGGGGGVTIPVGAYIKDESGLRFRPNTISLLAVGIPFVWVAGKALARVIRVLKK